MFGWMPDAIIFIVSKLLLLNQTHHYLKNTHSMLPILSIRALLVYCPHIRADGSKLSAMMRSTYECGFIKLEVYVLLIWMQNLETAKKILFSFYFGQHQILCTTMIHCQLFTSTQRAFFNFQDMIMAWHVDESSRDPRELSICFFQNNIKLQILIFCVNQLFLNYFQDIKIQYQHM